MSGAESRQWQPGDVALVRRGHSQWHRALWSDAGNDDGPGWFCIHGRCSPHVTDSRPLVVIDPEDREQVGRLLDEWSSLGSGQAELLDEAWTVPALRLRQALLALLPVPRPEVYEHLTYQKRGKTAEAVCGKTWIPDPEVTVVGRCPECADIATKGWTA